MQQVPESVGLPSPAVGTLGQIIYWCQGTWKALTFAFRALAYRVNRLLPKDGSEIMTKPLPLARYTTALLPTPALGAGAVAYVSDASAGARLQYYTGSIWEPDGLVLAQIHGLLTKVTTFTTGGTFTAQAGTTAVFVRCQAGGGAGGSVASPSASQAALAGAGAAGGYSEKYITTSFSPVTVTIGAGGVPGASGNNAGGAGGSSSFGALLSATGGGGGAGSAGATPPFFSAGTAAGVGSGGDWSATGGPGGAGQAVSTTVIQGGAGGASQPFGPATGGRIVGAAGTNALTGFGNGGTGGTAVASGSAQIGGAGNPGIIIVYEYS